MTAERFIKDHPELHLEWRGHKFGTGMIFHLTTPRLDNTKATDKDKLTRDEFKEMVLQTIDGLQEYYRKLIIAYCDL